MPTSAPVAQTSPDPSQTIATYSAQTSNTIIGISLSKSHCTPDLLIQSSCKNGSDSYAAQINHLPPEILSEIFLESLPAPNTRLSHHLNYLIQVLRVTHVCGQWRSLGIATPRLWTYLQFTRSSPREIAVATSWLERSGSQPISFNIRTEPLSFKGIIDLLTPHSARWKHASIHWPQPHSRWSLIPRSEITAQIDSLPLLERLSTTTFPKSGFPSIFCAAPKLRKLSLEHMGDVYQSSVPWKQINYLTVDDVLLENCLEMLEQSPNLLTLKIKCLQTRLGPGRLHHRAATSRSLANIPDICLAFLTKLNINRGTDGGNGLDPFFDHLTFPSLTHFHLRKASRLEEGTYLTLASMLSRSSTTSPLVLTLDIGLLCGRGDRLVDILRTTPHVLDLELCGSDDDPTRTPNVFDVLTISDERCLLPNLQRLAYLPDNSIGNYNSLATMIWSRREGEKQGAASGLRTVLIENTVIAYETRRINHVALVRLRQYAAEGLLSLPGLNG